MWAVLVGLVLGGALIAHALRQIALAFPDDVRANAVDAVKKRPRIAVVTLVVAAWTLLYALYSLAYPSGAAVLGAAAADTASPTLAAATPDAVADNRELLPPSIGGELALPPSATATVTPDPTPTPASPPTTTPPTEQTPPPSSPPTTAPAEPCPAQAIEDALGPAAVGVLCPPGSNP